MSRRKVRVVQRKLGRTRALGTACSERFLVEIDPRQRSRCYLDTLIHEMLHLYNPTWSENKVNDVASEMTRVIWANNYRRVEP